MYSTAENLMLARKNNNLAWSLALAALSRMNLRQVQVPKLLVK
jgi:hypothetical protein